MHYFLLLATVSVALAADAKTPAHSETPTLAAVPESELNPEESASPIRIHDDERHHHFEDGLELIRSRGEHDREHHHHYEDDHGKHDNHRRDPISHDKDDDHHGPVILRTINPHHTHEHPDIERQNRIIADVYSPDYYQPTWILDYRYLKTGGRDYTRGPGGQVIILPKNVRSDEHKEFPDFDSLLEHLRLSHLSEHGSKYGRNRHRDYYHDDYEARHYAFQKAGHGGYHRGQNWWKTNTHH